jgi:hypothetical protein
MVRRSVVGEIVLLVVGFGEMGEREAIWEIKRSITQRDRVRAACARAALGVGTRAQRVTHRVSEERRGGGGGGGGEVVCGENGNFGVGGEVVVALSVGSRARGAFVT